jgi:hypothetical protein
MTGNCCAGGVFEAARPNMPPPIRPQNTSTLATAAILNYARAINYLMRELKKQTGT